ncbi:MAG: hypothetical protein KBB91_02405 [Candidatus Pacebacteria bacterium]|jgi:hypothetical protein|nr:hypothetical protein [Candidatus Paceibacterota bacterium]MBP9701120.1 hypothetical protein [Candidatus Paceibacterota bacterium]
MEPNKKITPLFFFLSFGTVVALIVSVSAFLNLAFETLNHALPDILTDTYQYGYMNYSYEGVRSALALLIIIFPIYLILEHFWSKQSRGADLSMWNAILRKWAIYLVLFLASITIITDLVILVQYFVSGEITTRFVLKVALTLLVAGKVGYYYIRVLRGTVSQLWRNLYAIGSSILVIVAIIWSFSVIGSPASQRQLRIDQRRIEDLQSIQWQVINYWQQKEKLPESLAQFNDPIANYMTPRDPEFQKGKVYEYKKVGDKSFELCATFSLPMPEGWVPGGSGGGVYPMTATRDIAVSSMPYPGGAGESWDHEAGRTCFTRTIDPDLYPPYPKEKM